MTFPGGSGGRTSIIKFNCKKTQTGPPANSLMFDNEAPGPTYYFHMFVSLRTPAPVNRPSSSRLSDSAVLCSHLIPATGKVRKFALEAVRIKSRLLASVFPPYFYSFSLASSFLS